MGLASMTFRRVRKIVAWFLAVVVIVLLMAGGYWVITQVIPA